MEDVPKGATAATNLHASGLVVVMRANSKELSVAHAALRDVSAACTHDACRSEACAAVAAQAHASVPLSSLCACVQAAETLTSLVEEVPVYRAYVVSCC